MAPPGAPLWLCIHGHDFGSAFGAARAWDALPRSQRGRSGVPCGSDRDAAARSTRRRRGTRLPVGCEVTVRVEQQVPSRSCWSSQRGGARLRTDGPPEAGTGSRSTCRWSLRGAALDGPPATPPRRSGRRSERPRGRGRSAVELDPLSPASCWSSTPSWRARIPRRGSRRSPSASAAGRVERAFPSAARIAGAWRRARGSTRTRPRRRALARSLFRRLRIARQPDSQRACRIAIGLLLARTAERRSGSAPRVVADTARADWALAFRTVSAEQRSALEALVAALPPLESLGNDAETARRLVVSRVIAQKAYRRSSRPARAAGPADRHRDLRHRGRAAPRGAPPRLPRLPPGRSRAQRISLVALWSGGRRRYTRPATSQVSRSHSSRAPVRGR